MSKSTYLICLLFLLFITTGCNDEKPSKTESDNEVTSLANKVGSDFNKISKIEVVFGDGREITIDNIEDINLISEKLKSIKVEEKPSEIMDVGYLYLLKIYEEDRIIRISNDISIERKSFRPVGNERNELNIIIIELGRKKFPDLLSGIDK